MLSRMQVSRCCCDEPKKPNTIRGAIDALHGPGVGSIGDQDQFWVSGSWGLGINQAPAANNFNDGVFSGANYQVKGLTAVNAVVRFEDVTVLWDAIYGTNFSWEISGVVPPVTGIINWTANEVLAATKTVARVAWEGSLAQGSQIIDTPDLSSIINEIINDPAYENDQRIELLVLKSGLIEGRQTNQAPINAGDVQLIMDF